MIQVTWGGCVNNEWCSFYRLNLSDPIFNTLEGVYIIFYFGYQNVPGNVVRVGQGYIRDRLTAHRQDQEINGYRQHNLLVTWAPVALDFRGGVERWLAMACRPLVGDRFPDVRPLQVNLPFGSQS